MFWPAGASLLKNRAPTEQVAGSVVPVFNTSEPGGPCGPVAPVAPVAPVGPVAPVAPVEPVGPAGPVAPVGPTPPFEFTRQVTLAVDVKLAVIEVVEAGLTLVTVTGENGAAVPLQH